ncbi:MAG: serine/threonine protein phosphatase [Ignisphaera sp.]|nr:serine/threonine protein phosphatase [Ignisphaera sp.]
MSNLSKYMNYVESVVKNYDDFRRAVEDLLNELLFEQSLRDRKRYVELKPKGKAVFIGDVHGDYYTLLEILDKVRALEILEAGRYIVFLGDYIDRGEEQIRTVALLAKLKTDWRDRVVMLRGNHEPPPHLTPSPHDFPHRLMEHFGYTKAEELYELMKQVFEALPLILYIPEAIVAFHGGPPVTRMQRYTTPQEILDIGVEDFEEVLWSDPVEEIETYEFNIIRGAGLLWGYKVTEEFLSKVNAKMIIRGHEPCEGYKFNHREKVLTLFSMKGYYGNTYAGALTIDLDNLGKEGIVEQIRKGIVLV